MNEHVALAKPPSFIDFKEKERGEEYFSRELTALGPRLRSYAGSLARDRVIADDLVQETMLRAWASRDRFEFGSNLRAWLFTILRNVFLSSRRRDRFHGEYDELSAERCLAIAESQTGTVELDDVMSAIEQLPSAQRDSLVLVGVKGFSYEEAARLTHTAVGTVKSRVGRARAALQARLDGQRVLTRTPKREVILPTATGQNRYRELRRVALASGRPMMIG